MLYVDFGKTTCGWSPAWLFAYRIAYIYSIHKSNIPGLASKQIGMSHQVNLYPFLSQVSGIHQVWSSECILTSLDSDQLKKYPPLLATKYQVSTTKNIWIATHHPFCSTSNPKRLQKIYNMPKQHEFISPILYHRVDLENLGDFTWLGTKVLIGEKQPQISHGFCRQLPHHTWTELARYIWKVIGERRTSFADVKT